MTTLEYIAIAYLICGYFYARWHKSKAKKFGVKIPKGFGLILMLFWLPHEVYDTLIND